MAALPNIGGTFCSMPQSMADAHYLTAVLSRLGSITAVQQRCQVAKTVEISWGGPNW